MVFQFHRMWFRSNTYFSQKISHVTAWSKTSRSSRLAAFHVVSECWEAVPAWEPEDDRKCIYSRIKQLLRALRTAA